MFNQDDKSIYPIIAGPCAVESYDQLYTIAKSVKESGATFLRGGAYKPRTKPNSFQGHGEIALQWLHKVSQELKIPTVSELMDPRDIDLFMKYVDVIQIGSRNMQNYSLLKEVGKYKKPVILKRGASATYDEFLWAAEYIRNEGNENIVLCERGIRTFSNATNRVRNTLDISAVPMMKQLTDYPIIVDPSHACGRADFVPALTHAAVAVGADGVMIEVHNNPEEALSDGYQSLTLDQFHNLCRTLHLHR